jgi:hypothetical protein
MIQTKVARIVSPTELIFAAGADDGVEEGMEFIVYSLSDPVTDPDTGEALGRIEIVKARLTAAHVQDQITIARTKSKTVKRVVNVMADMLAVMEMNNVFGIHERSEVVAEQMAVEKIEAIAEVDLVVRVGDLARTVLISAKKWNRELALA